MEKKVIVLFTVIVLAIVVFVAMQLTGNAVMIQQDGTVKDAAFPALNPGEQAELDLDEQNINPGPGGQIQVYCGDGICQVAEQDVCVADCPVQNITTCGNGMCDESENYFSCAQDCSAANATCGDGICDSNLSEDLNSCVQDCNITLGEAQNIIDPEDVNEGIEQNNNDRSGSSATSSTNIPQIVSDLKAKGEKVYFDCAGTRLVIRFGVPENPNFKEPLSDEDCKNAVRLSPGAKVTGSAIDGDLKTVVYHGFLRAFGIR